jgi:HAE1 family hydrophobic/amphiphilic exporter-1
MEPEKPESQQMRSGERMVRFAISHPVTVCMTFASLMVLGFVSMTRIPVVLTPDISFPFVQVWLPYPNATPGQVLESFFLSNKANE